MKYPKILLISLFLLTGCHVRTEVGLKASVNDSHKRTDKIFVSFENGTVDTLEIHNTKIHRLKLTDNGNITDFVGNVFARDVIYYKIIEE